MTQRVLVVNRDPVRRLCSPKADPDYRNHQGILRLTLLQSCDSHRNVRGIYQASAKSGSTASWFRKDADWHSWMNPNSRHSAEILYDD